MFSSSENIRPNQNPPVGQITPRCGLLVFRGLTSFTGQDPKIVGPVVKEATAGPTGRMRDEG
jgi:hypothetical protein